MLGRELSPGTMRVPEPRSASPLQSGGRVSVSGARLVSRLLPPTAMRLWQRGRLALSERRYREFRELRERFYRDFWAAAAEGRGATVEALDGGYLRISRGADQTFVRGPLVMLDDHLSLQIAGDKPLVHRLLREWGCPVPEHAVFRLRDLQRADRFLADHGSVVVKPCRGTGAGRGVTTGIRDGSALRQAAYQASALGDELMVERQVSGSSYRLLFLGGECIDAVRRDAPTLAGDGRRSVAALIRAENRRRLAADPIVALHPLRLDLDCRLHLRAAGLSPRHVPADGEPLQPKQVVNENAARENHRVMDQVHPTIIAMGREIAGRLGLELMGLDLLCSDISVPLAASGGVINEINTTPGLHHHALVHDRSNPLALGERLIDYLL